ncbi:DUF84 family protein [Planococcus salinus]|uniref:inosine/xanthosine triphosphatase n=1 Tax=Planococcus salinus TaxID=1848460 RepID=A0A3M8PBT6_9BACL|nr:DUF84 family protein [Planococcus salinus]RNF40801.1 DUF84 family protein [Planococcus salinus]
MNRLQVAVASKNAAKIKAVEAVLEELEFDFALASVETDSGVAAQPLSQIETRRGAINRAQQALGEGMDFAIGLEGGVYELEETMYLCNWGALAAANGQLLTAGGAQIRLPEEIGRQLKNGMELGPVMDRYANETGIRHHKGAVGILTAGLVNRNEMFEHVVKLLMGQYLRHSD